MVVCLVIIGDKTRPRVEDVKIVKDKELKLRMVDPHKH
jgi:hypothetical protein